MNVRTRHQQSIRDIRALGALTWFLALGLSSACGSKTSNGSSSETPWLKRCTETATCPEGRCESPQQQTSIDSGLGSAEERDASTPADRLPQSGASSAGQDSSAPETGDAAPMPPKLCDGSSQVRFIYNVYGGGPLPFAYDFYGLYGHELLMIDGQCNYYSARPPYGQVRQGQLAPDVAQRFAARVGYVTFSSHVGDTVPCPDAGPQLLWGPQGSFRCYCDCGTGQPLLNRAREFNSDAFTNGSPLNGPVEMVLLARINDWGVSLPWPLKSPPGPAIEGWATASELESAVVVVTDPSDAAALRNLRSEWALLSEGSPSNDISVDYPATDAGSIEEYSLFLRDSLPQSVLEALMTARAEP